jgi:hypothetical protein
VLREVVAVLHERVFAWVGLSSGDGETLTAAGEPPGEPSLRTPVVWQGKRLGELQAEPREAADGDRALLDRVALLISAQLARSRP